MPLLWLGNILNKHTKTSNLVELFTNVKFLIVNAIIILILFIVLIVGDGKKVIFKFYENITGQKIESFTPVENTNMETYFILKDKLLRDKNIILKNTDVSIYKKDDTFHKYRIEYNNKVIFYKIEKLNETWQIIEVE